MKLYLANGVTYIGTQADAKRADKGFKQVEVPTDKEGLIAFLNAAQVKAFAAGQASTGTIGQTEGIDLIAPEPRKVGMVPELGMGYGVAERYTLKPDADMYETVADRVLSPPDADGIVQRIMAASGYELKRYASAVAQRFAKMGE